MDESNLTIEKLPDVSSETQQFFQDISEYVVPLLKDGRPFDLKHTFAVTYWAGQICLEEKLDPEILIPAALFHDTGYTNLFKDNSSENYEGIQEMKTLHMEKSEQIAREFISNHKYFSKLSQQKLDTILFIIKNHDKVREPELVTSNKYLIALVEADTFGIIDTTRVDITFDRENLKKFIDVELIALRKPLITSPFAQEKFPVLLENLYNYYEKM